MFGLGVLPTIVLIVVVFLIFRGVAHWMYGEDDTDMHTYYKSKSEYEDQLSREISDHYLQSRKIDDTED